MDMWKGVFNGAVSSVSADGSVVGTAWGHICKAWPRTDARRSMV